MSAPAEPDNLELVEVRLTALPIPVWGRAQEHADELIREFTLMAGDDRGSGHGVPAQLTELIGELTGRYGGFTAAQESALAEAAAGGVQQIELTFQVPVQAAQAAAHLSEMLDAADAYCQAGQHLLTLATPPEALSFRRWYLSEFTRQIEGAAPTPWPQWVAAQGGELPG